MSVYVCVYGQVLTAATVFMGPSVVHDQQVCCVYGRAVLLCTCLFAYGPSHKLLTLSLAVPPPVPSFTPGGSPGCAHPEQRTSGALQGFAEVLLRRVPFSLLESQVMHHGLGAVACHAYHCHPLTLA